MFRLGAILFPLMLLAMLLKQKGPVSKFLALGAVSEGTARKPPELTLGERYGMPGLVDRGVLIALDDGRYYVDVRVYRRRRRVMVIVIGVVVVLLIAGMVFFWPAPDVGEAEMDLD